ncbi:MAG: GH3 auxin-responsive promoter family protein [Myxococcota bacterium]|nr:GH3 auxin-responsive promoter family protein [Myxococcota bacterium]
MEARSTIESSTIDPGTIESSTVGSSTVDPGTTRESSDGGVATAPAAPPPARQHMSTADRRHEGRALKRSLYPHSVGQALHVAARVRVALWDRALRDVEPVQNKQLRRIVDAAKNTTFGRRHGFADIRTWEQYAARVPVGDYDSHAPAFEAMRTGESGILVSEKIKYFGNSSGSSSKGKSKFLPISERQIAFQRGSAADSLYRYLVWRGDDDFTGGYTLGLFPPTTMRKEGPVFITTNPSLQSIKMPAFSKLCQIPEPEIREITDYDLKLERIADKYLDHDVRSVAGTTCWFSILFDKLLAAAKRRGRKADCVADLWPNLRVLLGGGVSADPYLPVIRERMGHDDITLVDTYNATEGGIFACSDHSGEAGMLMIPDRGVFYEFVPVEDASDLSGLSSGGAGQWPRRVPLWGVETGKLYAIHVTTVSGLYSYRLGDLVRFTSTSPHRVEFAGRVSGCLSTTQELTTHVEIQRAVEHALVSVPATTVDYGCGADVGVGGTARSRYVLFAEFAGGQAPSDAQAFARAFDEGLCKENRVYREHRKDDVGIFAPELVVLPPGSVRRFMKDIGNVSVQTKFPRILDDDRKQLLRSYVQS